jgi:hypothetical protein
MQILTNYCYFGLGCAVRFRLEAKQSENEAKKFSLRSEKKQLNRKNAKQTNLVGVFTQLGTSIVMLMKPQL